MADQYLYQKKRKEFGRHGQFGDSDVKITGFLAPDPTQMDNFIPRDPNRVILSNIPKLSTHSVSFFRGFILHR